MRPLFLITARGGSKGIPGKNIKPLAGKPLIYYSIDVALSISSPEDICLSTDSSEIADVAEKRGIKVPFIRPAHLAGDTVGSHEVIVHALNYYREQGVFYKEVVLLQPTSPFRRKEDVTSAMDQYHENLDMVAGVKISSANPYYNLYEENADGFLHKSKEGKWDRRQDSPVIYEFNGAVYVINSTSVLERPMREFSKVKKYIMDDLRSVDLDLPLDWKFAEFLIKEGMIEFDY